MDRKSKLTFELAQPLLRIGCPGDLEISQHCIHAQAGCLGSLLEGGSPVDGRAQWHPSSIFANVPFPICFGVSVVGLEPGITVGRTSSGGDAVSSVAPLRAPG